MKTRIMTMLTALSAFVSTHAIAEPERLHVPNVSKKQARHGHWGIIESHSGSANTAANSGYIDPCIRGVGLGGKLRENDSPTYLIGKVKWKVGERNIYVLESIERDGKKLTFKHSDRIMARIASVKINEIEPKIEEPAAKPVGPVPQVNVPAPTVEPPPAPVAEKPLEKPMTITQEKAPEQTPEKLNVTTDPLEGLLPQGGATSAPQVSEPTLVVGEGDEKVVRSITELNQFAASVHQRKLAENLPRYTDTLTQEEHTVVRNLMKHRGAVGVFLVTNSEKLTKPDVFAALRDEFDAEVAAAKKAEESKAAEAAPPSTPSVEVVTPPAQAAPPAARPSGKRQGLAALIAIICLAACVPGFIILRRWLQSRKSKPKPVVPDGPRYRKPEPPVQPEPERDPPGSGPVPPQPPELPPTPPPPPVQPAPARTTSSEAMAPKLPAPKKEVEAMERGSRTPPPPQRERVGGKSESPAATRKKLLQDRISGLKARIPGEQEAVADEQVKVSRIENEIASNRTKLEEEGLNFHERHRLNREITNLEKKLGPAKTLLVRTREVLERSQSELKNDEAELQKVERQISGHNAVQLTIVPKPPDSGSQKVEAA